MRTPCSTVRQDGSVHRDVGHGAHLSPPAPRPGRRAGSEKAVRPRDFPDAPAAPLADSHSGRQLEQAARKGFERTSAPGIPPPELSVTTARTLPPGKRKSSHSRKIRLQVEGNGTRGESLACFMWRIAAALRWAPHEADSRPIFNRMPSTNLGIDSPGQKRFQSRARRVRKPGNPSRAVWHRARKPGSPSRLLLHRARQPGSPSRLLLHRARQPGSPSRLLLHRARQPGSPSRLLLHRARQPGSPSRAVCTVHEALEVLPDSSCTVHGSLEVLPDSFAPCTELWKSFPGRLHGARDLKQSLPGRLHRARETSGNPSRADCTVHETSGSPSRADCTVHETSGSPAASWAG
jgi:hypothetical protein